MLLTLNPQIHRVCEWPLLRSLRKRFPKAASLLMGYYHRGHRTWVVARWADKLSGVVDELLVGNSPGDFAPTDLEDLAFMLDPRRLVSYKQWARQQVAEQKARDAAHAEHCQQLQDIKRFITKRLPGVAKDVEGGGTHSCLTELAVAGE